jgi:hypothetical protein
MDSAWRVRPAADTDLPQLRELLDLFAAGHPAARHPRPPEVLAGEFFGPRAGTRLLVAERGQRLIGFAGWRPAFDMFWAMHGGEAEGLFVRAEERGRAVAVGLVAAVCADIRARGGEFLRATYNPTLARLYERVVIGETIKECHLSATAFQRVADLAGKPARELVRLPDPALNLVPIR